MLGLQFLWLILVFSLPSSEGSAHDFSKEQVAAYREKVRSMFYHAYDGYLEHAFPLDNLMPLTCKGTDTWGSFSLTLVDSLSTLVVLGNYSEFRRAAKLVETSIRVDANVNVSVFETNIRVVGGLLSAHMLSEAQAFNLTDMRVPHAAKPRRASRIAALHKVMAAEPQPSTAAFPQLPRPQSADPVPITVYVKGLLPKPLGGGVGGDCGRALRRRRYPPLPQGPRHPPPLPPQPAPPPRRPPPLPGRDPGRGLRGGRRPAYRRRRQKLRPRLPTRLPPRGIAKAELEAGWPCQGPLLRLAARVADKLLPAFNTATGMPYGTVNLRYGVHRFETPITCTAGVGTYLLEFGSLSRLTGNPHYERIALRALQSLWARRSSIDLVGNHVNVETGAWTATDAGIGAGVDSYFEYLAKGSLLFQRPQLMEQFMAYRDAINAEIRQEDWFMWVGMAKGGVSMPVFQSLEAFWPGVLSLVGDTDAAMRILATYRQVLRQYGFTPEFFNIPNLEAVAKRSGYPLRPELVESTMYLYRATKDPQLLHMGAELVEVRSLEAIEHSSRTSCGYATVANVKDHTLEDRMESFFLSETTKYLYLLFDPDNFIHNPGSEGDLVDTPDGKCVVNAGGYFFNTEAHPIDPSILYCCSEQRKKDLELVADFEKDLDFLDLMGVPDAKGTEHSDDFQLHKDDLPKEIRDLDEPFVRPQGTADQRPSELGYQLTNGSTGSVPIHPVIQDDEEVEGHDQDSAHDQPEEELAEEVDEEKEEYRENEEELEVEEERRPLKTSFAEAAAPPKTLQRPPGQPPSGKVSMDELLSAHAGSDPHGLRLNLTKAIADKAQGSPGSKDFADNLVKAFSQLLGSFDDLVEASNSLASLDAVSHCDERLEFCPQGQCRRMDRPTPSRGLNRLLNLLYAKERRLRPKLYPTCHWSEEPKEADKYRNATPNLRHFAAPLVSLRGSVRRLGASEEDPFAELAELNYHLMSCPLPSFLSKFAGLGQVVPTK